MHERSDEFSILSVAGVCILLSVRNDASGTIIFLSGILILLFSFSLSFIIMTKTDYKTHTPFHDAH